MQPDAKDDPPDDSQRDTAIAPGNPKPVCVTGGLFRYYEEQ